MSNILNFFLTEPHLQLLRPLFTSSQDDFTTDLGDIYTPTPTFEWEWAPVISNESVRGTFHIKVTHFEDGTEYASATVVNSGDWTYSGDTLRANQSYIFTLIYPGGDFEFQPDTLSTKFTYSADPDVPELLLERPSDGITVTDQNPQLRWSFPEYHYSFGTTFYLTIAPVDTEGVEAIEMQFGDGRRSSTARTYTPRELAPEVTYEWSMRATYTPTGGEENEVTSETWSFMYNPPPWEVGSTNATIINALKGVLPQAMIDVIIEALRAGYIEVSQIRLDGAEIELEEILTLLRQENIEVVLINVGQ